jgi:hypothetical protein
MRILDPLVLLFNVLVGVHLLLLKLLILTERGEGLNFVETLFVLVVAVGSWNFVIIVNFFAVENKDSSLSDDVLFFIDEVPTPVDISSVFIVQLPVFSLDNKVISLVVNLEISNNVFDIKVRNLSHSFLRQSYSLAAHKAGLVAESTLVREFVEDPTDEALGCFVVHSFF